MNTLKWAITFCSVAILAALLGFVTSFGGFVTGLARFLFFLSAALCVILSLIHLFIGDYDALDAARSASHPRSRG